VLVELVLV
jgi:hypothetical protein